MVESKHYKNVGNPFSEFAYKWDHFRKSEVDEDSCRTRKVSKYFQKVEQECKVEHRKRVLSPYFLNKQGRKDYDDVSGDLLCQHGTFEENLKVEENSCRIMKVSKYSQKDEQEFSKEGGISLF